MSWLTTAQSANYSPSERLTNDIKTTLSRGTRFYIRDIFFRIQNATDNAVSGPRPVYRAEELTVGMERVLSSSPFYASPTYAYKWMARSTPEYYYNNGAALAESQEQWHNADRITVNGMDIFPYFNESNGIWKFGVHPSTEEIMQPHRRGGASGFTIKISPSDAGLLNQYAFSTFSYCLICLLSRSFREDLESRFPVEQVARNRRENRSRQISGALVGVVSELANRLSISGNIFTSATLSRSRSPNANAEMVSGLYNDIVSESPHNVYLSFRGSLRPEPAKLTRFINMLSEIINLHFPDFNIREFSTNEGLVVAIERSGEEQTPQPTKLPEPKEEDVLDLTPTKEEVDSYLADIEDDPTFATSSKSVKIAKKNPIVVSFDYDGVTVLPDDSNGYSEWDENGEAISHINPVASELMKRYAARGDKVVIVAARDPSSINSVWKMIKDNGLPVSEVYATSHQSKVPTLRSIGASIHYDDNQFVLEDLYGNMDLGNFEARHDHEMEKDLENLK